MRELEPHSTMEEEPLQDLEQTINERSYLDTTYPQIQQKPSSIPSLELLRELDFEGE